MGTEATAKYTLTVSSEQLRVISAACETYARMHLGQLDSALHLTVEHDPVAQEGGETRPADWFDVRERTAKLSVRIAGLLGHPGIRNPGVAEQARVAWDVYQVARNRLYWSQPEPVRPFFGGPPVEAHEPNRTSLTEELPPVVSGDVAAAVAENALSYHDKWFNRRRALKLDACQILIDAMVEAADTMCDPKDETQYRIRRRLRDAVVQARVVPPPMAYPVAASAAIEEKTDG